MNDSLRISVSFSEEENPIEGLAGQLGETALVAAGIWLSKRATSIVEITRVAPERLNMGRVYINAEYSRIVTGHQNY